MSLQEIENIILSYLKEYTPESIFLFGSYARGEQQSDSDIDLLVKFKNTPSLLQLIKMEQTLSTKLGIKVDLLTEGSIQNKRIKSAIKKDMRIIYHA